MGGMLVVVNCRGQVWKAAPASKVEEKLRKSLRGCFQRLPMKAPNGAT